ncbi:MAG: inverse autotransporter beta domain-containing protein [Parachlamydiaceae bacterium]
MRLRFFILGFSCLCRYAYAEDQSFNAEEKYYTYEFETKSTSDQSLDSDEKYYTYVFETADIQEDQNCSNEKAYCDTYNTAFAEDKVDILALYAILSHDEGKGIGYHQGYTSLDFFLMPSFLQDRNIYPFIDLRAHGMDNQKIAANAGVGFRFQFADEWLAGVNTYYDYRQGEHHGFDRLGCGFQQIGVGFEALGPCFDLRLNLYRPVGKTISNFSQIYFFDNRGITPTIFYKKQVAAKGFDAEIGGIIASGYISNSCWDWNIYLAGGPYYLQAMEHTGQWGGKARLEMSLGRYFYIKTAAAYDKVNRGAAQICLGVNIPLYPFTSVKPVESYYSPNDVQGCLAWRNWVSQQPKRVEIMPLRSRHVIK